MLEAIGDGVSRWPIILIFEIGLDDRSTQYLVVVIEFPRLSVKTARISSGTGVPVAPVDQVV